MSLPPSDLPKHGPGFDLPIAIGLLAAGGNVPVTALDGLWAVGELGLGGDPAQGGPETPQAGESGGGGGERQRTERWIARPAEEVADVAREVLREREVPGR